jgi:AcrR family transcriptional regulator
MDKPGAPQMISFKFQDVASDQAKRLKTRALLMDSAVVEFARQGIEKTSVNDIIARARVSHGTFYYHFSNKNEIVETVGRAVAAAFVNIVDREINGITLGPERVAMATQIFIRLSSTAPDWGWLVVHALADMGSFQKQISRGIRKDVLIGIRQGEFIASPDDFLFASLLAVVSVAVRTRLEHPKLARVEQDAATLILQMLGISTAIAQTLPRDVTRKFGVQRINMIGAIRTDSQAILQLLLDELSTHERDLEIAD